MFFPSLCVHSGRTLLCEWAAKYISLGHSAFVRVRDYFWGRNCHECFRVQQRKKQMISFN